MSNNPLVSIIFPVYNDEKFLPDIMESILWQTYSHWELIIVDDASTDNSPAILSKYEKEHPQKIRVIYKSRHSRPEAWNILYQETKGDYICVTGADDIFMPEKLAQQVEFLEKRADIALVHSEAYWINEEGKIIYEQRIEEYPAYSIVTRLFFKNFINTSTVMLRKSCVEKAGGLFKEEFAGAQDYELWLRLARNFKIGFIKEPLVKYRVHEQQLTRIHSLNQKLGWMRKFFKQILEQWKITDVLPLRLEVPSELSSAYVEIAKVLSPLSAIYQVELQNEAILFFKPIMNIKVTDHLVNFKKAEVYLTIGLHSLLQGDREGFERYLNKISEIAPAFRKDIYRKVKHYILEYGFYLYFENIKLNAKNIRKVLLHFIKWNPFFLLDMRTLGLLFLSFMGDTVRSFLIKYALKMYKHDKLFGIMNRLRLWLSFKDFPQL